MHHLLFSYIKSFIQALLIFFIIAGAVDWWRKPTQPPYSSNFAFTDLNGDTKVLQTLSQKQTTILYFWGSWCNICRYTSPTIEKLYHEGIPVISIALKSGDNHSLQNHLNAHQLTFPTVNDSNGLISHNWKISAVPTIILIKNGKMLHATTGFSSYWGLRIRLLLSRFAPDSSN